MIHDTQKIILNTGILTAFLIVILEYKTAQNQIIREIQSGSCTFI